MNRIAAGLLATLSLLVATVAAAMKPASDPAVAWQNYLADATSLTPGYSFPYQHCFRRSAQIHDLPESLLLAVARGESDFDAAARSRANAHGIMQIQWPQTARHLGILRLSELYDPCTNIDAGARYLRELLERYAGDLHLALAAYNYGPGRIRPGAASIPPGAVWYSGYIFRHLEFVLGDADDGDRVNPTASLYSEFGRTVLLSFGEPYRAAAFVAHVEESLPQGDPRPQIDWFRTGVGRFDVVFSYSDKPAFEAGAAALARSGFPLQ